MSGDGSYAPKSPDLSSFFSEPLPNSNSSAQAQAPAAGGYQPAYSHHQQAARPPVSPSLQAPQPTSLYPSYTSSGHQQHFQHQQPPPQQHDLHSYQPHQPHALNTSVPSGYAQQQHSGPAPQPQQQQYGLYAGSPTQEYYPPQLAHQAPQLQFTTPSPVTPYGQQQYGSYQAPTAPYFGGQDPAALGGAYQQQPPQQAYPGAAAAAPVHEQHPLSPQSPGMPRRLVPRAATKRPAAELDSDDEQQTAAAAGPSGGGSSSAAAVPAAMMAPSPVRTKFPTARIKRIMQADEEVGKVAQQTPIAVGKALELFMVQLVTKSADLAREKNSKRVSAQMLRQVVEGDDQWDFLREIVSRVENVEEKGAKGGTRGGKAAATAAVKDESDSDASSSPGPKKKGRGRKKKV